MNQARQSVDPAAGHISDFLTDWATVDLAVRGTNLPQARSAQERLLLRYERAIRAYLWGAVRDDDRVDELFQQLSIRLIEGRFGAANPERGRFRDYLKSILYRMVVDDVRSRRRHLGLGDNGLADAPDPAESIDSEEDARFVGHWREELLDQAWRALADDERSQAKPYHAILRLRAEHAEMSHRELAAVLSARLDRPVTEARVGTLLHEARERFATHVLDAVANTLEHPTLDAIEEEIIALNLHRHKVIHRLLERRRARAKP